MPRFLDHVANGDVVDFVDGLIGPLCLARSQVVNGPLVSACCR
jgi:hypothetical protein